MEYFYSFFANFMATTLGVFLALAVQRWYEGIKNKQLAKETKLKIKEELIMVQKELQRIRKTGESALLLAPIGMPVFQSLLSSSQVTLLNHYSWYGNLLSLYKLLDKYNAWQELKAEKAFDCTNMILPEKNRIAINNMLASVERRLLGDSSGKVGEIEAMIALLGEENE